MSAAKTKTDVAVPDDPKPVKEEEIVLEDPPEEIVAEVVAEVEPGVPAKRAIGPKEPPPFKWKLIGHARHMALTLFKAAEREDVEAQLERTRKEGYYTNLQILDINTKVEQPPQPKPTKKALREMEVARKEKATKAAKAATAAKGATAVADATGKSGKKSVPAKSATKTDSSKSVAKASPSSKKPAPKKPAPRKPEKKKK